MATNTKTFSNISGGYRANGNAFTLLSSQVLSSTSAVKIHSVTIDCGVGNAYGYVPYVVNEKPIHAFVNSSGNTVYYGDEGGYFFYPGSNVSFPSSSFVEYNSQGYYTVSGYGTNFVSTMNGSSTNLYATINDMSSQTNNIISNEIPARHARCGTIGGDSSRVVYGVCPGTDGYESKTLTFNPDITQLAAGETFNLKVYCSGSGVLCIPSGSSVVVTYEEIEVDEPSSGKATGTVTFNTSGDYSTFTTTISASTFDDGNYNNWQYVSFPSSVQTISGSAANYMTSGYKYPSLQNIISATRSRPSDGADSLCLYNGELYFRCDGPNDISDITVEYSALFPNSITVLESGTYEHVITITGSVTPYELSSAASSQFVAGTNALVFPEISGWHLRVVPDNLPNSSIVKYATYTKIQNTTINVSGLSNNYNVSITTSIGSTETITSNGTYTIEGALTIDRAYDNGFSEDGTISYEDNNVINIEFREYRDVNIWLVDTSKPLEMDPPAENVLVTISYSNGTSQSVQTPYRTSENPMYWGLSETTSNTNAPGVTITSVLIGGIEVSNKSGITIQNTADYSITGQSSGIFPDFGPWKSVIPYVYITGTGWVKYEDTRVYNSSTSTWEQYDWKVYSEVVITSNEYGETVETALYDTIENDDGTMVIM